MALLEEKKMFNRKIKTNDKGTSRIIKFKKIKEMAQKKTQFQTP